MSDLVSPIDTMVKRNVEVKPQQEIIENRGVDASAIIDAIASTTKNDTREADKFSWAAPTTTEDSGIDFAELETKGIEDKTLSLIKDLTAKPRTDNPQVKAQDDKSNVAIMPKIDPTYIAKSIKVDGLFDPKLFEKKVVNHLATNPIAVELSEDVLESLNEAGLSYMPALIDRYAGNAVRVGAELAIQELISVLPSLFEQYSEGLSQGVESATFDAQVLGHFSNDLEVLIAKSYAPKYVKANPTATPEQTAKAIKEYIASKSSAPEQTPAVQSNELGVGNNAWFKH